jgi:hypothetical protein
MLKTTTSKTENQESELGQSTSTTRLADVGKSTAGTYIIGAVALLWTLVLLVPWNPSFLSSADIDGWRLALHYFFEHQKQWGTEVIFTFGPLGFLYTRMYYPSTYLTMISVWAILGCLFCYVLLKFSQRFSLNNLARAIWLFPTIAAACSFSDVFFYSVTALFLANNFLVPDVESAKKSEHVENNLLSSSLSLFALIKVGCLFTSTWAIIAVAFERLFTQKRFPFSALVFVGFIIAFWCLAHQNLTNFPAYILHSCEISKGYCEAMALPYPSDWLSPLVNSLDIIALLAIVLSACRLYRRWPLTPLLAFAGIFLLSYKAFYIRHGAYANKACCAFLFFTLLLLPAFWTAHRRFWNLCFSGSLGIGLTVVLLITFQTTFRLPASPVSWVYITELWLNNIKMSANHASKVLRSKSGYQDDYVNCLRSIQDKDPLPALTGGVDLYSCDVGRLIAAGHDYNPRPVFQSYSVFNSALNRINDDHLLGKSTPDWIWFQLEPQDLHFPSLEDGLSWIDLLRHYKVEKIYPQRLLLMHSSIPAAWRLVPVSEQPYRLGETVKLPQKSELLWATITVRPTILGRLQLLVWKIFAPSLKVNLKNGDSAHFSAPSGMLESGFLLSPGIFDNNDFANLFSDGGQQSISKHGITSFALLDDQNHMPWAIFENSFLLKLWRFEGPN